MTVASSDQPVTTWANWLGNERFETHVVAPRDEAAVADSVRRARSDGSTVRVVGSGHSSSPLHRTSGTLLSLDNLRGVLAADPATGRARVLAGTKISELGAALWGCGLGLANQGEIDRQAIVGAMATGTHGSGRRLQNLATYLKRARIVTGTGEVVEIDESTSDELRAARVAMGMLGVMTEVEIELLPAYELTEWLGHVPFEKVMPFAGQLAEAHRNFSILWFPTHQSAVNFDTLPPDGGTAEDSCFVKMYDIGDVDAGPIAEFGKVNRVDRSYRVYPDAWEPQFYEMEYMLPLDAGLECYPIVRDIIGNHYPDNHMPVQLRFVDQDDAYLSQNYGRASAVISVTTEPGRPQAGFFDRFDELFTSYDGRPHWGKLHRVSVERLERLFPEYERFCEIRRKFDPDGVFLNDHLRPLFA